MDKPKPVGVARITGVQDVEHVPLVPPDLPHSPHQQVHNNITDIPVLNCSLWSALESIEFKNVIPISDLKSVGLVR